MFSSRTLQVFRGCESELRAVRLTDEFVCAVSRLCLWIWYPDQPERGTEYDRPDQRCWPKRWVISTPIDDCTLTTSDKETFLSVGAAKNLCAVGTSHGLVILFKVSRNSEPRYLHHVYLPRCQKRSNPATRIRLDDNFLVVCAFDRVVLYKVRLEKLQKLRTYIRTLPYQALDARVVLNSENQRRLLIGLANRGSKTQSYGYVQEIDFEKSSADTYIQRRYRLQPDLTIDNITEDGKVQFRHLCGYRVVDGLSKREIGKDLGLVADGVGAGCLFAAPHTLRQLYSVTTDNEATTTLLRYKETQNKWIPVSNSSFDELEDDELEDDDIPFRAIESGPLGLCFLRSRFETSSSWLSIEEASLFQEQDDYGPSGMVDGTPEMPDSCRGRLLLFLWPGKEFLPNLPRRMTRLVDQRSIERQLLEDMLLQAPEYIYSGKDSNIDKVFDSDPDVNGSNDGIPPTFALHDRIPHHEQFVNGHIEDAHLFL